MRAPSLCETKDESSQLNSIPGLKLLRTLRGHKGTIGRFSWSPCGRFIASPSFDRTIRIWDVSSGEMIKELEGNTKRVVAVAWSPDGKRLISAAGEQSIRLWDVETGVVLRKLSRIHGRAVVSLAWSPEGKYFASAGWDGSVGVWDGASAELVHRFQNRASVMSVAWSNSGDRLAAGGSLSGGLSIWAAGTWKSLTPPWAKLPIGCAIYALTWHKDDTQLFCASKNKLLIALDFRSCETTFVEGHTGEVKAVSCSSDGRFLATKGGLNDNSVRIWTTENLSLALNFPEGSTHSWRPGIAFSTRGLLLATLGNRETALKIWEFQPEFLKAQTLISSVSAKVVLVGESNVGKSYLAHRITTGERPLDGEIKSTHGMKFWSLQSSPSPSGSNDSNSRATSVYSGGLFGTGASNESELRKEVVLWDMGGQEEYRLIHQLFLRDTTIALVLFDPTRGRKALEEVATWNKAFEKHLQGRDAVKLLVGAKIDEPSDTIDYASVQGLCKEAGFAGYYETSAVTGRGVHELCAAIGNALEWQRFSKTKSPELFQRVRDIIEEERQQGELVISLASLYWAIRRPQSFREHREGAQSSAKQDLIRRFSAPLAAIEKVRRTFLETPQEVYRTRIISAAQNLQSLIDAYERYGFSLAESEVAFYAYIHDIKSQVRCIEAFSEILADAMPKGAMRSELRQVAEAGREVDNAAHDLYALLTVSEQLAAQGRVARSRLSTGEPVLVLQVQEIERYAGSLVLAARKNPRGVPAVELRSLGEESFRLPGIRDEERLAREQEKAVVDSTVHLMLEHGICFQHEGLLIFPSLFSRASESAASSLSCSASLYYDFAGAIDNIYASLVAWLVLAKEFGKVRLWSDRAEFEVEDGGLCGLLKRGLPGGFAHVDVYFDATTPERKKREFISFVEDHLARSGVEIKEQIVVVCPRHFTFDQETLRLRIAEGAKDVLCPRCEQRHSLLEGAADARIRDPKLLRHTVALRTRVEGLREKATTSVVSEITNLKSGSITSRPIRLLHLSDLHFTKATSAQARLQCLLDDIKGEGGLRMKELDYLVISGDFTDKGCSGGFEKSYEFVSSLTREFHLSADRCILVPGNHDTLDLLDAYSRRRDTSGLNEADCVKQGTILMARDPEKYPLRFKCFSDSFYHKFLQRPYPMDYKQQGASTPFWDTGIQFLTLNSCWQIDEFYRKRSGVHPDAVANAVKEAQQQIEEARRSGEITQDKPVLRIGVWHHAVSGNEQIRDLQFLGNLQKNGVRVALHGDLHEHRRDLIGYWTQERIFAIGAGSFGARAEDRPEASPRLYNLLEIERELRSCRVHTRCQPAQDGPWKGWYEWPDTDDPDKRVAYYDVKW